MPCSLANCWASALKVEAWIDRWIAIKPTRKHLIKLPESEDSPIMGITINGLSYYSEKSVETMMIKGRRYDFNKYTVPSRPDLEEFLEELQEEEYSDE